MAAYTTSDINELPIKFNSINKKIDACINEFKNSFDLEKLKQLIIEIKDEYKDLKNKILEVTVEIRINILEIEDPKVFDKYRKYCTLKLKAINKILEPIDIDLSLNNTDGEYDHTRLENYARFEVPELLNLYNISGYLYTYSFMLLVLKKSIVGIVDNLIFKDSSIEDLEIFDKEEKNKETLIVEPRFKLSMSKGVKIDVIRILHSIYELRLIENQDGQIPTKKDFMVKVGEFFGADFSKYDSDLSQALNNITIEKNLDIFNKMMDVIKKNHFTNEDLN